MTRFFTRFFHQHLISKLSIVEQVWPNDSIFHWTFLSTFQLLIFLQRISAKYIYHHKYLPAQGDAIAHAFTRLPRQGCQTSRFSFSYNYFARFFCQRSNFAQHHLTPLDSLHKVAKRLDFSLAFSSSRKSSRLAKA